MGFRLAAYARKIESPEALITAARIIGTTPVRKGEEKLPDGVKAFDPVAEANGLIAEALKMPRVTDGTRALAETTRRAFDERPRGAPGGPRVYEGFVPPGGTRSYQIPFVIGELATITVRNQDDADLDLYVTCNRSGWSINDRGGSRDARVAFTVGTVSTDGFTVRVVNYSTGQASRYVLFTN
jgi:hypothetical protein